MQPLAASCVATTRQALPLAAPSGFAVPALVSISVSALEQKVTTSAPHCMTVMPA